MANKSDFIVAYDVKRVSFPTPKQSANALFNFMRQRKFLEKILYNKAIFPRYVEEIIDYLELPNLTSIAFPMTCFCDINLSRIEWHAKKYGTYGIAFHKIWGIENHIQPIQYITKGSILEHDFRTAFMESVYYRSKSTTRDNRTDYLLSHLAFMKQLIGKNTSFSTNQYYFHDEREWRYIPNLSNIDTELPSFLVGKTNNATSRKYHSDGMKLCNEAWLKFDWKDIKYIVTPNRQAKENILDYIRHNIIASEKEKYTLVSKVIRLDELKEDI